MPIYHLSIRLRERLYQDDEGEEIAGEMEMREQALQTVRNLTRTASLAVPDWLDCILEVTNEAGTWCSGSPSPKPENRRSTTRGSRVMGLSFRFRP
jgi:hypothetical protein